MVKKTDEEKVAKDIEPAILLLESYLRALCDIQQNLADSFEEALKKKEEAVHQAKLKCTVEKYKEVFEEEEVLFHSKLASEFVSNYSDGPACKYKNLLKCFRFWLDALWPIVSVLKIKSAELLNKVTLIPLQMSGWFAVCGDHYKALICLRHVIKLQTKCVPIRVLFIKMTLYLGEWEMCESALAMDDVMSDKGITELEDERRYNIRKTAKTFISMVREPKEREKCFAKLLSMLEENTGKAVQTFQAAEFEGLLYYCCSYMGRFAKPSSQSKDVMHCLEKSASRLDRMVCSWFPELRTEKGRLNMLRLVEDDFSNFLNVCFGFAECFEVVREAALEALNTGLLSTAMCYASRGFIMAYKLGNTFRVQQFLNLKCLIGKASSISVFKLTEEAVTRSLRAIYSMRKNNSCFSTPKRCQSPGRAASPGRNVSIANVLLESFQELTLSTPSVHLISSKCACETCFMYFENFNSAMENLQSQVLLADFSLKTVLELDQHFTAIRDRVIPEQIKVLGKKLRPRPPISMCESYSLYILRWLRSMYQKGIPVGESKEVFSSVKQLVDNAIKIGKYAENRCTCYLLGVGQMKRELSVSRRFVGYGEGEYSWMGISKTWEYENRNNKTVELCCPATMQLFRSKDFNEQTVAIEALEEFQNYNNLMYREWRLPITSFLSTHFSDPWLQAMVLVESTVISSRQQARCISSKLAGTSFVDSGEFKSRIRCLPRELTLIQIVTDATGHLYLLKLHAEREPIIIPVTHPTKLERLFQRVEQLVQANDNSSKNRQSATKFWAERRKVDNELKETVNRVENYVFADFRPLLLPSRCLTVKSVRAAEQLQKASTSGEKKLPTNICEELVSLLPQVNQEEWTALVANFGVMYGLEKNAVSSATDLYMKLLKTVTASGSFNTDGHEYVLLVVAPIMALFPFELMPVFKNKGNVARISSIHAIFKLLHKAETVPREVSVENSYYILDPDNNLAATRERMTDLIGKFTTWEGVVGKAPDVSRMPKFLEEKDLFIYMGHGNGNKYFGRSTIKNSNCNAVSILMGCGSIAMEYEGWGLDGQTIANDFSVANCPCLVGCSWMVTDGEIDRYTLSLLDLCFSQDNNETIRDGTSRLRALMEAMNQARATVKLPYLTGGAVISYGLPIVSSQ